MQPQSVRTPGTSGSLLSSPCIYNKETEARQASHGGGQDEHVGLQTHCAAPRSLGPAPVALSPGPSRSPGLHLSCWVLLLPRLASVPTCQPVCSHLSGASVDSQVSMKRDDFPVFQVSFSTSLSLFSSLHGSIFHVPPTSDHFPFKQ